MSMFSIGGVAVDVALDDPLLADAIGKVLAPADSRCARTLRVTIACDDEGGVITAHDDDPIVFTTEDLRLGAESGAPDFPFRVAGDGAFAWLDDAEPLFVFDGNRCRFTKRPGWREAIALLLLHCVYRIRRDTIFFHAATVDVGGSGVMFIGRKGAGKSTSSLALAARGHALLGDETAAYVPATGQLEPFRRPVGIKPGPRAQAVTDALVRTRGRDVADEIVRVGLETLIDSPEPKPVPLRAIVFLQPFASRPTMNETTASAADIARMQPVGSSFVNASHSQRTFELARMLSRSRVFHLAPGDPDDTARVVEETIGGLAS